jgi:hypothetical protein
MNSELESKILCREIGRLVGPIAGIGARWAARRLPSVAHEVSVKTEAPASEVFATCSSVLRSMRKEGAELPSEVGSRQTSAIVGSGIKNLNPTLVCVAVADDATGSSLLVRAVAKEGSIFQRSAELAVEGFMTALQQKLPVKFDDVAV